MHIYINRDGQQFGPYTIEQVRDYMESGNLIADDLAWYDEAVDWVPLGEVPGVSEPVAGEPVRSATPDWVPPRRDTTPTATSGLPGQISRTVPASNTFTTPVQPGPSPSVPPGNAPPPGQKVAPTRPGDPFRRARRASAIRKMIVGALLFVGAAVVALYSYLSSPDIPHHKIYLMAAATIVFGGVLFVLGVIQYRRE